MSGQARRSAFWRPRGRAPSSAAFPVCLTSSMMSSLTRAATDTSPPWRVKHPHTHEVTRGVSLSGTHWTGHPSQATTAAPPLQTAAVLSLLLVRARARVPCPYFSCVPVPVSRVPTSRACPCPCPVSLLLVRASRSCPSVRTLRVMTSHFSGVVTIICVSASSFLVRLMSPVSSRTTRPAAHAHAHAHTRGNAHTRVCHTPIWTPMMLTVMALRQLPQAPRARTQWLQAF
jgi:hypothetical protein